MTRSKGPRRRSQSAAGQLDSGRTFVPGKVVTRTLSPETLARIHHLEALLEKGRREETAPVIRREINAEVQRIIATTRDALPPIIAAPHGPRRTSSGNASSKKATPEATPKAVIIHQARDHNTREALQVRATVESLKWWTMTAPEVGKLVAGFANSRPAIRKAVLVEMGRLVVERRSNGDASWRKVAHVLDAMNSIHYRQRAEKEIA